MYYSAQIWQQHRRSELTDEDSRIYPGTYNARRDNLEGFGLNPEPGRLVEIYAILDDRERPVYEHRLAA